MPKAPLLAEADIAAQLQTLNQWKRDGQTLHRTVQLGSFMPVIDLVNRVAEAAESANHHPDIDIRYNQVTFGLTTHDSGGLTHQDMDLARRIDELAASVGGK